MGVCSQFLWLAHRVTDLLVREVTAVDLVVVLAEATLVAETAVETVVEVTEVASVEETAEATKRHCSVGVRSLEAFASKLFTCTAYTSTITE